MFKRKVTHEELERYLRDPIEKYGWEMSSSPEKNVAAKVALTETLRRAKEMLPRTGRYFIGKQNLPLHDCNIRYLEEMLIIRKSMSKKQWIMACSELVDVLHFCCIEDGRILNAIIGTLEEYL